MIIPFIIQAIEKYGITLYYPSPPLAALWAIQAMQLKISVSKKGRNDDKEARTIDLFFQ